MWQNPNSGDNTNDDDVNSVNDDDDDDSNDNDDDDGAPIRMPLTALDTCSLPESAQKAWYATRMPLDWTP